MIHTIDVLLATYNGEKYLREQLDSILSQSYQDFHLMVRDDGSNDNTLLIINSYVKKYPNKITLVEDNEHLGVLKCFSELVDLSKAPYVMFADQDDVWLNDKVLMTLHKMQEIEIFFGKDKPLLVHGDLKVVYENLKEISPSFWAYTRLKPRGESRLNRLIVQNEITGCTIMMNRSLSDLANPIPTECTMYDWWIALVASAFGHIGIIQEPYILYRQHSKNTLGAKKFRSLKQIWARLENHSNMQQKKRMQALSLLKQYETRLSQKNLLLIQDYVSMGKSSILKNRYLMLKHRFFKHGFGRNLYNFFLTRHP